MSQDESFPRRVFFGRVSGMGALGVLGLGVGAGVGVCQTHGTARASNHEGGTVAIDNAGSEDFGPWVGEVLPVKLPDGRVTRLRLASVEEHPATKPPRPLKPGLATRAPFSLLLLGPGGKARLGQGTYPISLAGLGVVEIFIVPVGPNAKVATYEAVFN